MTLDIASLKEWINEMAAAIDLNEELDQQHYAYFLQEPELALRLVALIDGLDEALIEENRAYYSACIFALDICVAQLQAGSENNNKLASKMLNQLMAHMAAAIATNKHSLSFWLPILNAFYEVHVELSEDLKNAYFNLANEEDDIVDDHEEVSHLNSIRDLIAELADLSEFEITENFFAQSYAMPADFFSDLVVDLYSIEEGQEIALLSLMHPKQEVREMVVATLDLLLNNITLSSVSLSRLQAIKNWYPASYHDQFNRWIKKQRLKGVVFNVKQPSSSIVRIKASEVDGTGAQGIFIHLKQGRKNRLGGLLFKSNTGIKDVWLTPFIPASNIARYYDESFDDSVMLREVDQEYLLMITNHFLALTIEMGAMPALPLLELQETLGINFYPQKIEVDYLIEQLAVQVSPFTEDALQQALKRTKTWPTNKRFTESWYIENPQLDKLVNRCCSFVDGVKVCHFEQAIAAVFAHEMELCREQWKFHFLWIALWLRSKKRKNEKIWQDSFFIAYGIQSGMPLNTIPIMHEICYQSVVNSIETMQERRTHLNQE